MARRFSTKAYSINNLVFTLRFEADELNEQGMIVDYSSMTDVDEYFKKTFAEPSENSLEKSAQEVFEYVEDLLNQDPSNVYKNLMGDEYPRAKLLSVDVAQADSYTATYGE